MSAKDNSVDASKRALFRKVVPTLPEKEEKAEDAGPPEELTTGLALMRQGRFKEAIDPLRTLAKSDPNQSPPHRLLGLCLYMDGQYIQARVEFERVIRIEKQDNLSALYLALCLMRLKRTPRVVRALQGFSTESNPEFSSLVTSTLSSLEAENPDFDALVDAMEKDLGESYVAMLDLDGEDAGESA